MKMTGQIASSGQDTELADKMQLAWYTLRIYTTLLIIIAQTISPLPDGPTLQLGGQVWAVIVKSLTSWTLHSLINLNNKE